MEQTDAGGELRRYATCGKAFVAVATAAGFVGIELVWSLSNLDAPRFLHAVPTDMMASTFSFDSSHPSPLYSAWCTAHVKGGPGDFRWKHFQTG
jgi:hypothetical protein